MEVNLEVNKQLELISVFQRRKAPCLIGSRKMPIFLKVYRRIAQLRTQALCSGTKNWVRG